MKHPVRIAITAAFIFLTLAVSGWAYYRHAQDATVQRDLTVGMPSERIPGQAIRDHGSEIKFPSGVTVQRYASPSAGMPGTNYTVTDPNAPAGPYQSTIRVYIVSSAGDPSIGPLDSMFGSLPETAERYTATLSGIQGQGARYTTEASPTEPPATFQHVTEYYPSPFERAYYQVEYTHLQGHDALDAAWAFIRSHLELRTT